MIVNPPSYTQVQKLITPIFSLADFLVQGEDKYAYYKGVTCAYVNNPGLQPFCDLDPKTRFFAIKKIGCACEKKHHRSSFLIGMVIFLKDHFPNALVKLNFDCKISCIFLRYTGMFFIIRAVTINKY